MKLIFNIILVYSVVLFFLGCNNNHIETKLETIRHISNINNGWNFQLGDSIVYSHKEYNDSLWTKLDLPHDWSVEGKFDTIYGTDWQSGYLPAGKGWYRKEILINVEPKEYDIELLFDGVYRNSSVYVNGNLVGNHKYGYTGFFYNISNYLNNGENSIAVRVDHSKPKSSRWYTGSGIYRNVWLKVLPKTHFKTREQYVRTNFVNDSIVDLDNHVVILNNSQNIVKGKLVQKVFNINYNLLNKHEESVELKANDSIAVSGKMKLIKPELWSLDYPKRHILVNQLYDDNKEKLIDSDTLFFGIRKIEFSSKWGFKLNDTKTKIKGVCMHHAAGIYGAAVPKSILYYRLKMLKKMGCNAIRTAHNPFSPEFYTICDTLGILVLDEIFDGWEKEKAEEDYGLYFEENWKKDVENWVKTNRNHPSVFMYSIGNEVSNPTRATQQKLIDFVKRIDDTRPITQGGHDPTRGMTDQLSKTQLDIKGFNGDGEEIGKYESYHNRYPEVPLIATEVPHTYQTRGVYRTQTHWRRKDFPAPWEINNGSAGTMRGLEGKCYPIPNLAKVEMFPEEKTKFYSIYNNIYPIINPDFWKENLYYQSSYDNATVRSSARKAWQRVEKLDYVIGQFRWTAFDYMGETNLWPSRFANFGIIDIANLPKDHYYLYKSLWSDDPMVHILPHWTHSGKEGKIIPVVVYTNAEEVELFLNNKSLGKKSYKGEQLVWNVPYSPGTISAKAYINKKLVAQEFHSTANGEHSLRISASKNKLNATNKENALVFIDIVDNNNGSLFPYADDYITVEVEGAGRLRGLDNGDPLDLTPYNSNSKKAFRGKIVAFIEANNSGIIDINIKTKGGQVKTLQLTSN
ncbi:glycoside hydrolase family 2 TIM barrel-domain containing protein [Tenacibaculum sp.]|uniref:glycoside hydrolase family 2 TIM barrel-domain containing protein n=1 Tax=Tenacibaculum sp. TaxID=1906242 RepID=UPI003D0DEB5E